MSTLIDEPFVFNGRRPTPAPTMPIFRAPTPSQVKIRSKAPAPANRPSAGTVIDGVQVHPRVVGIADEHGTDLRDVAQAVKDPEEKWKGKNGRSTVHLRGDLAAITADDTGEVIALASRNGALRARTEPRDGAVKRTHGGAGNTMPTTVAALLDLLDKHGLTVERDTNHYVVRRPGLSGQCVVPKTPSDCHAIPNAVMEIRRRFGVDVRNS